MCKLYCNKLLCRMHILHVWHMHTYLYIINLCIYIYIPRPNGSNKPTSWIQGYTLSYGHFARCLKAPLFGEWKSRSGFLCVSFTERHAQDRHFWLEFPRQKRVIQGNFNNHRPHLICKLMFFIQGPSLSWCVQQCFCFFCGVFWWNFRLQNRPLRKKWTTGGWINQ